MARNLTKPPQVKVPPPEHFRATLQSARRGGADFDEAWELAWTSYQWSQWIDHTGERREWKAAMEGMRDFWEDAYERRPTTQAEAIRILTANVLTELSPETRLLEFAREVKVEPVEDTSPMKRTPA